MFPLAPFTAVVLCLTVFIAACTDLQARRIPNWLTFAALPLGLALNAFLYGLGPGLKHSFLGMALALLIYVPLFVLRGMGAGDVKLMAVVGALAGPANWLRIFVLTAILGGIAALALVLYRGAARRVLTNVLHILASPFRGRAPFRDNPEVDVTSGAGTGLPHGAVIAFATFIFVYLTAAIG